MQVAFGRPSNASQLWRIFKQMDHQAENIPPLWCLCRVSDCCCACMRPLLPPKPMTFHEHPGIFWLLSHTPMLTSVRVFTSKKVICHALHAHASPDLSLSLLRVVCRKRTPAWKFNTLQPKNRPQGRHSRSCSSTTPSRHFR